VKESRPDPRQNYRFLAEDIQAGGPLVFPHQAGALVGSVMPVAMPDGRVTWFPAPSFTALYLVEAKGHLDRGKRLRTRAVAQLRTANDGKLLVTGKQAVPGLLLTGQAFAASFCPTSPKSLGDANMWDLFRNYDANTRSG